MRGCTTPVCTTIKQETAAARTPLSANAMAITRFARTPSTRAMRKSSAAARICKPSRVDRKNQVSATEQHGTDQNGHDLQELQPDPDQLNLPAERRAGNPGPSSREPTTRISVFCRKKLTAKDEINSVVGSALRSGRKAARSVISASTTATKIAPNSMTGNRQAEQRQQRVGGEGDQFAVCEIDQPHHAENQTDAERGQRIEAADADGVDECLDEMFHQRSPAASCMWTPK